MGEKDRCISMRSFRLLTADEIECRIARQNENGVQLLLYKTARTDYAVLDESVGVANWQCDYKEVDGKVYCGIGIKMDGEWIWKWNCGAESNMESEKGEASDALKRAGFAWGIGTELYSSPFIWIKSDKYDTDKNGKCSDRFKVVDIGFDEQQRICRLEIDNTTKRTNAFSFGGKRKTDRTFDIKVVTELAKKKDMQNVFTDEGIVLKNGRVKPYTELTDEEWARAKEQLK